MTAETAAAVKDVIMGNLLVTAKPMLPESRLVEDLGADSLDVVEIRIEIEDRLGVQFTDNEWDGVSTVQDAIDLADKKIKEK